MRRLIPLVGTMLCWTHALGAQDQARPFELGAHAGQQVFARGTALHNTTFVGLDATYQLPWHAIADFIDGATIGVGLAVDLSRPVTRGDQFPLVVFDAGDTTFLYTVAQRTTLLQGSVQAVLSLPIGSSRVYGFAGPGLYSIRLDPRAKGTNQNLGNATVSYGGGITCPVGSSVAFRAEVTMVTFTGFDRGRLDATQSYVRDVRLGDAAPAPDATSRTPTNRQFSLAMQYFPGRK